MCSTTVFIRTASVYRQKSQVVLAHRNTIAHLYFRYLASGHTTRACRRRLIASCRSGHRRNVYGKNNIISVDFAVRVCGYAPFDSTAISPGNRRSTYIQSCCRRCTSRKNPDYCGFCRKQKRRAHFATTRLSPLIFTCVLSISMVVFPRQVMLTLPSPLKLQVVAFVFWLLYVNEPSSNISIYFLFSKP